ncbi:MAG: hypothetical protein JF588_19005 [Caulobacterales bacterium]|nr:hypothetical protein [Caulobacterales bacterium]
MADTDQIAALLKLAADDVQLLGAQRVAAKRLLAYDGELYPHDGCAITLSVLLQDAGIAVADNFQAIQLTHTLRDRGWSHVPIGEQRAGDVGTTCGDKPLHGQDHIYLVLKPLSADEMVIADNQDTHPHFRFASGHGGKTPTRYFLRAG